MLKTSAYYDDQRFEIIKSKVIEYLQNNKECTESKLINNIHDLRQSDLDVMTKYGLINKQFSAFDDLYNISTNLQQKLKPKGDFIPSNLKINSYVNKTELDSINLNNEEETSNSNQKCNLL